MSTNSELPFGEWLRQRRQALDLTQEELARSTGVSVITIRKWEAGERRPSKTLAEHLADILHLPAAERAHFIFFARGGSSEGVARFSQDIQEPGPSRTNLPLLLPETVGRENDVARLQRWLMSPRNRLLTLVGPGGVGKSHLARHVGRAMLDSFADGVFFVPLAAIQEPAWVLMAIAQVLGLTITQSHEKALLLHLQVALRDRQSLLILDNFEHILPAAPPIAELVSLAPRLRILVTSRERLHVPGERLYPVDPLPLAEAITLFAVRAQAVYPEFVLDDDNREPVTELCSRLDCLPLAIELIAAHTQIMSPPVLLARLTEATGRFDISMVAEGGDRRPPHQQTLPDAIAWSHDLLTSDEQAVFRRLAVFAGSFTLEAAEAILAENTTPLHPAFAPVQVWHILTSLIDKSLLVHLSHSERLVMLQTIREFASGRLAASDELQVIQERHIMYFTTLAETALPHLNGARQVEWLKRLQLELHNLRTALSMSLDGRDLQLEWGLRLVTALRQFWDVRGYWLAGQRWLDTALLHRYAAPAAIQARLLLEAGIMAEYEQAPPLLQSSLALYRQLEEPWGTAQALNWLGRAAIVENEYPRAVELCRESLALSQQAGDVRSAAETLFNLGLIAWRQGDDLQAATSFEQCRALAEGAGNKRLLMMACRYLGLVVYRQAEYERSHTLFASCLALAHELAEMDHMAAILNNLSDLVQTNGQVRPAYEHYLQSLSLAEIGGDRWFVNWIRHDLVQVLENRAQGSDSTWLGDSSALFQKPDHELDVVIYLIGLAGTAIEMEQAAQLLGAADRMLQGDAGQLQGREQAEYDLVVATVRARLDEAAFARAWEAGHALTPEEAITLALKSKVNG